MTPLTLTPLEVVLGLVAATLFGAVVGYLLRGWREGRSDAEAARPARPSRPSVGGRSDGSGPIRGGWDERAAPEPTGLRATHPPRSRSAADRPADPWREQTPVDVKAASSDEATAGRPTVLVVDDRMELRAVHSAYLQQHGYRVLTAADGEQALQMARTHTPAVVVLDHSLPGRTGIEVTRELKRDLLTARIPVILMTAHSFGAIGMAARQAGVAAFLPKPVDPSRVLREVERHTRQEVSGADTRPGPVRGPERSVEDG